MATVSLVLVLVPVLLFGLLAAGVVVVVRRGNLDPETEPLRRRGALFTGLAAALGIVVVVALTIAPGLPYGLGQGLAPLVAGGAMVVVVVIHEATWPQPTVPVRTAALRHRTPLGAAPRWLLVLGGFGVVGLWVLDVVAIVVADPGGRSITAVVGDQTRTHSPFPGAFYAVPTLVTSLIVVALTAVGLWVLANRRGLAGAEQDQASRRLSAHRILRGAAFGHLATLAGHAVFAGSSIASVYDYTRIADLGWALGYGGFALGVVAVAALVIPSRAVLRLAARAPSVS